MGVIVAILCSETYFSNKFETVVLQPTTLCNLNCRYCYLMNRDKNCRMNPEISKRVANYIKQQDDVIEVLWHGGEPLASGKKYFKKLLEPFEELVSEGKVQHAIQTNATLIDAEWCEIFLEHMINIGVSIDGSESANSNRVDWSGKPAFNQIQKGINYLKQNQIPFGVIVVVSNANISKPEELYNFLVENSYLSVGFNIEEIEGANTSSHIRSDKVLVFWKKLFAAWKQNPVVRIREFDKSLAFVESVINGAEFEIRKADPFPTITWNGNVNLISPELAGANSKLYGNFIVGNILQQSLKEIIENGLKNRYTLEFIQGINRCSEECSYFEFCRGGHASNKHFENGSLNTTATIYCQNSKIKLIDAIIDSV